mmetsp:Transcript_21318/g.54251  ORF Transcript_21318/g.54251 Transcript_21318/m.54251 type:complete len:126 (+) Transcript_21318:312-689(+)
MFDHVVHPMHIAWRAWSPTKANQLSRADLPLPQAACRSGWCHQSDEAAELLRGSNREAGSTGVVAHTTVPAMLAASEAAASMPLSPASLAAMHRSKEGDSKGATADDETMGRQASPRVPAFLVQR